MTFFNYQIANLILHYHNNIIEYTEYTRNNEIEEQLIYLYEEGRQKRTNIYNKKNNEYITMEYQYKENFQETDIVVYSNNGSILSQSSTKYDSLGNLISKTRLSAQKIDQFSQSIMYYPYIKETQKACINDSNVRFRSSPFLSSVIYSLLTKGTKITILGRSKEKSIIENFNSYWYFIQIENGSLGWTYGAFIDCEEPDSIPIFNQSKFQNGIEQ